MSKEWVVEVTGGLAEAKLLAERENFELLAEVIPDSNLYHFKEKRINKRSALDTEDDLFHNQNVISFSHQTVNKV